jgi:threonine dehydrogenase-like Zn-dependent dehydrogenase
MAQTMRAAVYRGKDDVRLEEVPVPKAGFGEAIVKVTLTTICGAAAVGNMMQR